MSLSLAHCQKERLCERLYGAALIRVTIRGLKYLVGSILSRVITALRRVSTVEKSSAIRLASIKYDTDFTYVSGSLDPYMPIQAYLYELESYPVSSL